MRDTLYIVFCRFIVKNTHWTKGWKCLWRGHSVNQNRPLLSLSLPANAQALVGHWVVRSSAGAGVVYHASPNYLRKHLIPGPRCCFEQKKNAKKHINFCLCALRKNGFSKKRTQISSKRGIWIKRRRERRIPPLFRAHLCSIPQGMILDLQPVVKSLLCPVRPSPNGFFDFEASTP